MASRAVAAPSPSPCAVVGTRALQSFALRTLAQPLRVPMESFLSGGHRTCTATRPLALSPSRPLALSPSRVPSPQPDAHTSSVVNSRTYFGSLMLISPSSGRARSATISQSTHGRPLPLASRPSPELPVEVHAHRVVAAALPTGVPRGPLQRPDARAVVCASRGAAAARRGRSRRTSARSARSGPTASRCWRPKRPPTRRSRARTRAKAYRRRAPRAPPSRPPSAGARPRRSPRRARRCARGRRDAFRACRTRAITRARPQCRRAGRPARARAAKAANAFLRASWHRCRRSASPSLGVKTGLRGARWPRAPLAHPVRIGVARASCPIWQDARGRIERAPLAPVRAAGISSAALFCGERGARPAWLGYYRCSGVRAQ